MPKFSVGDIAIVTDRRGPMTVEVIAWRGGGVAPYQVRIIEAKCGVYAPGTISYFSGRDMEHKAMQGKKKIYCCVPKCTTYSFESSGTIQWQCDKHCPTAYQAEGTVSLEEKVELILAHLGLEVTIKPVEVALSEKPKTDG